MVSGENIILLKKKQFMISESWTKKINEFWKPGALVLLLETPLNVKEIKWRMILRTRNK